jgi:DNA polymerase III subunit beta
MKITCTQENLNKGLNLVSHIANKNSNLPILNNVLFKAYKDGLTLITTDLEIGVKVFVRSKIEEEGEFTVDAKLLNNFVSLLPKENIKIELKENSLEVKTKNQETSISGLEAEDFPLIPEIEKENEIEIPALDLKRALSQVIFAASLDGSRIEINAVNFNFKKNELIIAATDSYRLAEKKIKIINQKETNLIIPLKTLQELIRILSEESEKKLKIYFNENQILFVLDGAELISRVINGKYPDYQQIIPNDFVTSIKFRVMELVPAIKSVALFCKQGINDVKLSFNSQTQELIVATTSSSTGNSVAKITAEIKGQDNDIIFNYRYLLDGLSNFSSEEVVLKINNSKSPGLIQPMDNEAYLYLVMPIRQ